MGKIQKKLVAYIWKKFKKIRTKKSALEKTPSTMDAHQNTEDG